VPITEIRRRRPPSRGRPSSWSPRNTDRRLARVDTGTSAALPTGGAKALHGVRGDERGFGDGSIGGGSATCRMRKCGGPRAAVAPFDRPGQE
jgi:hypothetical protein